MTPCETLSVSPEYQETVIGILRKNPFSGYFFRGETGTGKTHLMWALFKEAAFAGRRVTFTTAREIIQRYRREEFGRLLSDESALGPDNLSANYWGPHHLFIDEFDKVNSGDFTYDYMFTLINHCYENPNEVVLCVATNLTEALFREVWGEAMARRISDITKPITWGDEY